MQKKILNILFSTRLTAVLFIVFALAMAIGTFLDANAETSPTPYTRQLIYNTKWFEAIMALFVVNFVGNIFRYRLHRKEKWPTLILHLSFILILVGAFITRYVGYEGMMSIREGTTESRFLSQKTYITAYVVGDYKIDDVLQRFNFQKEVDFSSRLDNHFDETITYDKTPVNFKLTKFVKGAEEDIIPDENGESYLKIVEAGGGNPHNHFLKEGDLTNLHNVLVTLNRHQDGAINIVNNQDGIFINSPYEGEYLTMATGSTGKLVADSLQPLHLRSRYIIGNMQLVFPKPVIKGVFDIVKKPQILRGGDDGVVLEITANNETKKVNLLGGQYINNDFKHIEVGGLDISLGYGSRVEELPFEIKLNDFIAEKYPGTEKAYSSYESKVTVINKNEDDFDYRIYMNNILDQQGYRFFQSSFSPDEKGTILSVNHDRWGTYVTYAGYFLLYLGLLLILFMKNTRFHDLGKQLKKIKAKKSKLMTLVVFLFCLSGFAQQHSEGDGHNHNNSREIAKAEIDSILRKHITPQEQADKFAKMVIQDYSGRMMPMHTYASEVLRKLSKSDTYEGFSATQVMLSIQESPLLWYQVPIIYLRPRETDSLRKIIGVGKEGKHFAFADFFEPNGAYKLAPYVSEAYSTTVPNGYQKKIKETDQRINLLYNAIEGRSIKIFPVPEDENNTWISSKEFREGKYRDKIKDSLYGNFINNGFNAYLVTLNAAKSSGDYTRTDELLDGIKKTQQKYGAEVMLSDEKVKTEILYNKYDIFQKLFSWYMYASTLLFIFIIIQIFKYKSKWIDITVKLLVGIVIALFLVHLGGLITRWYLSGHAPWSDAYESMIYVAWSVMLFGLLLGRKSNLTIAASAFVASMILMIAHWNWMDPAIGNLEPVLQGYWLMIHVSIIVGSYGPFAIGMILGIVALLLMIFTNSKNKTRMDLNIKELTVINEMALTIGLVMLTIGNFLGGMWANESWGRYWGWDPKETWALISIMVYAFVIHMRLVPGLRGRWFYNLMSILAFASILMTYFGVNFYLSGLHSYASGDQIISLQFIGIALTIIAILAVFAYRKYRLHYKK